MIPQPLGCTRRTDGGAALRILIDRSGYHCCNIGDTAMLQVALDRLREFWPRAVIQIQSLDSDSVLIDDYLSSVKTADLVLLSGAGSLNDAFARYALPRLEALELAMEAGAVTALVGQGIGPMSNAILRQQTQSILPRVDFIALRDGIGSLTLLDEIGVPPSKVMVTGDDAVELGYNARVESIGAAIGVNCRIAHYSGIDEGVVARIGGVVREVADHLGAPLHPLPISRNPVEDDLRTARLILHDSTELDSPRPTSPSEFLLSLPNCRVVVSGSYHAAVFALSMGIPAVGIAGCDYYVHKFRGLAHQFGPGCQVELTSNPDFEGRLRAAIIEAWQSAQTGRQSLLRAAVRQIVEGKAAYRHLFALVESRARSMDWLPGHARVRNAIQSSQKYYKMHAHGTRCNQSVPGPENLATRPEARHGGALR